MIKHLQKPITSLTIVFFCLGATIGCTTRKISMGSNPSGATVHIAGKTYKTPCEIKLSKETEIGRIELEGYEPQDIDLQKSTTVTGNFFQAFVHAHTTGTKYIGGSIAVAGLLGIAILGSSNSSSSNSDSDTEASLVSGALLLGGGILYTIAEFAEDSVNESDANSYYIELKPESSR
jgi:hypothetical protein